MNLHNYIHDSRMLCTKQEYRLFKCERVNIDDIGKFTTGWVCLSKRSTLSGFEVDIQLFFSGYENIAEIMRRLRGWRDPLREAGGDSARILRWGCGKNGDFITGAQKHRIYFKEAILQRYKFLKEDSFSSPGVAVEVALASLSFPEGAEQYYIGETGPLYGCFSTYRRDNDRT